jgi:hypothetical protein
MGVLQAAHFVVVASPHLEQNLCRNSALRMDEAVMTWPLLQISATSCPEYSGSDEPARKKSDITVRRGESCTGREVEEVA